MVELQIPGMSIESQTSIDEDLGLLVTSTIEPGVSEVRMISDGGYLIGRPSPVEYEGDRPVIDSALMIEGRPYRILVYGKEVWAVKESDGALSFYCPSE